MVGLALIALGVGTGIVALDLLLENVAPGPYQLVVFGQVIGQASGRAIVLLVTLVAAAAAAIVTYGIVTHRRERDEQRLREAARVGSLLESHRRLLTDRVEELEAHLAELEEARARAEEELRSRLDRARTVASVTDRAAERLRDVAETIVVLPETRSGRRPAGRAQATG
jgi:hypothetical protein